MAKIAIITRTKDRPVFLARALRSVAAQTFNDYEHVIINDGGAASEVERVVSELDEPSRGRVTVVHRSVSSNAPDTIFNESIDATVSEYVAIHDDDDTWHAEFLERVLTVLDTGAKGAVVRTDKIIETLDEGSITEIKKAGYFPDLRAVSLYRQCIDNQLTPIAFVYRRDVYEEIGKYDSTLPVVGDWEFGIRFLMKHDVEYLDPGFALANYHHRREKDNSFRTHDHRKYTTIVFNRYLRDELAESKLGVGYIMNSLRYEQDIITSNIRKLLPKPITNLIRKKIR